jgi:hypothetical protein
MMQTNDVGSRALERLYSMMMIDAEWSLRAERSFTWWPKDVAQTVSVSPPVESRGHQVCRLRASTPLVQGLNPNPKTLGWIDALNGQCGGGMSALVLDGAGTLSYVSAVTVHEQTLPFVPRLFAVTAAIQATEAQFRAPLAADVLGGEPVMSVHPSSGTRGEADDTLNIIERLVVPGGAQPSRWTGRAMVEAVDLLKGLSLVAIGDEDGIAVELPWVESTCLLELNPDFAHPHLGHCLHATLTLPDNGSHEDMLALTHTLNRIEALPDTLTDFRGSWCVSPLNLVTFSAMYPNILFQPGVGANIAVSIGARAEWLATLVDSRSRQERWENAQPAVFVAMGAEGNLSQAVRDPNLINMMSEAEGRPAFGNAGTLSASEVQERLYGLISRALQDVAGESYQPGPSYSRLWNGVRVGQKRNTTVIDRLAALRHLVQ